MRTKEDPDPHRRKWRAGLDTLPMSLALRLDDTPSAHYRAVGPGVVQTTRGQGVAWCKAQVRVRSGPQEIHHEPPSTSLPTSVDLGSDDTPTTPRHPSGPPGYPRQTSTSSRILRWHSKEKSYFRPKGLLPESSWDRGRGVCVRTHRPGTYPHNPTGWVPLTPVKRLGRGTTKRVGTRREPFLW